MNCSKCLKELKNDQYGYCPYCGKNLSLSTRSNKKHKRGNGQGSIYKRGQTWTINITTEIVPTDGGKIQQKRVTRGGFAKKSDALDYMYLLKSEIEERNRLKNTPTLGVLHEQYILSQKYLRIGKTTKDAYTYAWGRIQNVGLVKKSIESLTILDLQSVIDTQTNSYDPASDVKALLSHLYNSALKQQVVKENLSKYITLPPKPKPKRKEFLPNEIKQFWDAFSTGSTFAGFPLLMIYTGMMPIELRNLQFSMIDWEKKEIIGCGKKTEERKKKSIILADAIIPVLQTLCSKSTSTTHVLDLSRDQFYLRFKNLCTDIGVRQLTPYSCRHTCATELDRLNITPSTIQEIMRHAEFSTTTNYIHKSTTDAHDAVNKITV